MEANLVIKPILREFGIVDVAMGTLSSATVVVHNVLEAGDEVLDSLTELVLFCQSHLESAPKTGLENL